MLFSPLDPILSTLHAVLTAFGCMEAVLWRYPLYLSRETGPRQYGAVIIDALNGVTESHLLAVICGVEQPTCVQRSHQL
jgi:hypothetical protein